VIFSKAILSSNVVSNSCVDILFTKLENCLKDCYLIV